MEERSKEEILSDLYAIRAAMSLVSERQDMTTKYQKAIEGANEKIRFDMESVRKISNEIDSERDSFLVTKKIRDLSNETQELSKQKEAIEKEKSKLQETIRKNEKTISDTKRYAVKRFRPSVPIIFFVIVFSIGLVFAFPIMNGIDAKGWQIGLIFGLAIGVIPVATTFILVLIYYKIVTQLNGGELQNIRESKEEISRCRQKILHLENSIKELRDNINRMNEEISQQNLLTKKGTRYNNVNQVEELEEKKRRLESERKERENEEKQFILTKQSKITELAKESQEIINNAQKLYPVIDFRDWGNVDLIIFYYETGRADTMKEALQQVDRQRQNDTLVKAVGMATEMIAKTIQRSVGALEQTLDNSFRKLSVQLEFQHQTSLEEVSKLGEKLEAQNERLEKLNEQAEELRLSAEAQARVQATNQAMTNALLAKINVSSAELAHDMDKQMKLVHHIYV